MSTIFYHHSSESNEELDGCPLSCIIWLLCIEPFLGRIRENNDIRGIAISDNDLEIKLTAYANNFTVILHGSESSLRSVLTDFQEFSAGTGLRLNVDKAICAWIGLSRRRGSICSELNLKWLTRALIGSGRIHVLMGGAKAPPPLLRISGTNGWIGKIQTVFERSHRAAPDLVLLTSLT